MAAFRVTARSGSSAELRYVQNISCVLLTCSDAAMQTPVI
jgi:hypothetical protein